MRLCCTSWPPQSNRCRHTDINDDQSEVIFRQSEVSQRSACDVCVLQLQEQLDAVDPVLDLCTPQLKTRLHDVQQQVVERWEELRLHTEQREEELKMACQRYLFLNTVRAAGWTNESASHMSGLTCVSLCSPGAGLPAVVQPADRCDGR